MKWRNKIKFKRSAEEQSSSPDQSLSEVLLVGEIPQCDISVLPERAVLQVRMSLYIITSYFHNVCLKSGFMNLTSTMEAIF